MPERYGVPNEFEMYSVKVVVRWSDDDVHVKEKSP